MRSLLVVVFLVLTLPVGAEDWKPDQKSVQIPMRDGATLAADIYLPEKPGKYPTVLIQTPYDKNRMGAVLVEDDVKPSEAGRGALADMQIFMDRTSYAYVVVDWRGFFASKAALAKKKLGWKRGQDGYDTVEWIAAQSWSNGKVGTWGGSALGRQQFDTMLEHPPHLVCSVPLISPVTFTYDSFYSNGVYREAQVNRLDQLGFGVGKFVYGATNPDGFAWKLPRSVQKAVAQIDTPCLLVTGWWDNYPGQIIETFESLIQHGGEKARANSMLLIGPWDHVSIGIAKQGELSYPGAEKESGRLAKAFLDRWLLDKKEEELPKFPKLRYWQVNEEKWIEASDWSSIPRGEQKLFLSADGKLAVEKGDTGARTYTHDPADVVKTLGGCNLPPLKHGPTDHSSLSARKDVLAYSSGALAAPLRINGEVALTFDASINRADCNFTAWLCHVTPDGKAWHLTDTACRAKFMNKQRQPVTPGEKFSVQVKFPPTAATIPAGHQLRLYLSSSNYPQFERNSHTGAEHWDAQSAVSVDVTILHENAALTVPVLKE